MLGYVAIPLFTDSQGRYKVTYLQENGLELCWISPLYHYL